MAFEVNFSPKAIDDYFQIVTYLRHHFSEQAVDNFDEQLNEKINLLAENPFAFAAINKYDLHLRKCIINNITQVYYDVYTSKVEILSLFDGRQNPEKLKGRFE
jgi:plasmid stabilization system protein ParE